MNADTKGFLGFIKKKRIHIITWTFFIIYEAIIAGLLSGRFGTLRNYVIHYALNITLFYVHAHYVLTFSLKDAKQVYWRLPLFLITEIGIYFFAIYGIEFLSIKYGGYVSIKKFELSVSYFIGPLYRWTFFTGFATGYYFLINFFKERKKTAKLEQQRLNNIIQIAKSENAFLRAQIQPHFLFNTLDFIYHNAREASPIAAETILSLSEMMRYAVDSNQEGEFILLGDEIDQVENLINLHQLRQNHSLQIRFDYDDEVRALKIIPLVLITLVENIFKHGNLNDMNHPAEIYIDQNDGNLTIETSNLANLKPNASGLNSGMENIRKRLAYSYHNLASFDYYTDDNQYFRAKLVIIKV
ncbi:sensor histidine kinase [Pedobacter yonginense]|nr:histidine kinase [Pedobacter yonginense]